MNKIFLDTDVIINILKKKEDTVIKLKSLKGSSFFISPIVIAEIYAGAKENEYEHIENLFSFFTILEITSEIDYLAGKYAKKYRKAYNIYL